MSRNRPPVMPLPGGAAAPTWPKAVPANPQESGWAFPPAEAVDLSAQAVDDLLQGHGVTFIHWRAMKCPVGVVDADDERHPHGDHAGCSNGFLYRVVGPVTCAPSGNSDNPNVQDIGIVSQAQMQVTAPRFYDMASTGGEPLEVHLAPYDRMYLAEEHITVVQWQLFEVSGAATDRLDYPVAVVEQCVDAQGRDLQEGQDFALEAGLLKWLPGRAPGPNPDAGTGGVVSIRYRYRPYWYISSLPHEIRVSQETDMFTGERRTQVLQQQAHLQREYIFENQANDPQAKVKPGDDTPLDKALGKSSLRRTMAPRDGGWGPR